MLLIRNATIINEGTSVKGSVLVKNDRIDTIYTDLVPEEICNRAEIIEADNLYLIPGVIDDQFIFVNLVSHTKALLHLKAALP